MARWEWRQEPCALSEIAATIQRIESDQRWEVRFVVPTSDGAIVVARYYDVAPSPPPSRG